jgi:predicted lipoprotein with Yx(FWY)xxD motif
MMKWLARALALGACAVAAAGCGGSSGEGSASSAGSAKAAEKPIVRVAKDAQGKPFVVARNGLALYSFDPDTKGGESVCYGGCAQAWPPLLAAGKVTVGPGIDASLVGTVTRKDGRKQVTFGGWPMYYFAFDKRPGQTNGQSDKQVWWTMSPQGSQQRLPVTLMAGKGGMLTDSLGWVVYSFDPDKASGKSVCNGKCAEAWPPLTTTGAPEAGAGVDASKLGTFERADGRVQVTYNGWPLYYWQKDQSPGQTTGQGVHGVWWGLDAAGRQIRSK